MPDAKRPNVLIFMSDQHHTRFLGCDGHPLVQTPHMDRLAARGTRFRNAYCNFPLCCPSRMSFMTARLPSEIDCMTNCDNLRSDIPTFAHAFSAAGYDTILSGRMHFVGQDQRHGFDERIIADCGLTAYINPVTGWKLDKILGDLTDTPGYSKPAIIKTGPGRTGYHEYDELVAKTTADWLVERGKQQRAGDVSESDPFMMVVGIVSPHSPFIAPPEDYDLYSDKITEDDLPDPRLDTLHVTNTKLREQANIAKDVPLDAQRRARTAYHGLVTFTDRMLGQVLDALDASGMADDTIVVYTSDHGEQCGEHGMWWKSTFYEGSAGVPMIVAGPGVPQRDEPIKENVSLLDLGPTMLDLVGANAVPGATGRSFKSLIDSDGDASSWHDTVIAENLLPMDGPQAHRMVKRGPWKLNLFRNADSELYNLDDDPGEFDNRINDPACAAVVRELTDLALADFDVEKVARRMQTKQQEQVLHGKWIAKNQPAEPDPLWCETLRENWFEAR